MINTSYPDFVVYQKSCLNIAVVLGKNTIKTKFLTSEIELNYPFFRHYVFSTSFSCITMLANCETLVLIREISKVLILRLALA